jgi:anti-sigma B factor antagonist
MSGDGEQPLERVTDLLGITVEVVGSEVVVALKGELDASTAPGLTDVLSDATQPAGIVGLVLDMADLQFLDSAGLRVIIRARNDLLERRSGTVRIVNAEGVVARVLEITGIDQVLGD